MFSGYSFKKYIHASDQKVLDFLEKRLRVASNGFNEAYIKFAKEPDKRDIHIDFYVEREENAIVIFGKDYTTLPGALCPENEEAPIWIKEIKFLVEREDDNVSLVTGYFEENPIHKDIALFVAKKFYAIVENLGERFDKDADWCEDARRTWRELDAQLQKELGGHWGTTEWHRGPAGSMMRSLHAFIPNGVRATTDSNGEVVFTNEKPRKQEEFLDNAVVGNVLDVITDQLNNGKNSRAHQLGNGAIAHWDLEMQDMRPRNNEIVVNAEYWLERPDERLNIPANLTVMTFSAMQLTGSERDSGRVKLTGEISNESEFIRERFDNVWAYTLQTLKGQELPAQPATIDTNAAQVSAEEKIIREFQEAWETKVKGEDDRTIIRNLKQGLSPKHAAKTLEVDVKTIYNREAKLRNELSSDVVPYRQAWRKRKVRPKKNR